MNNVTTLPTKDSLTQPISCWFDVHPALGISPIDHLYNRLDGAYPQKWRANFSTPASIRNWKESWVETFDEAGITFAMVKTGMKVIRTKFAWPPSCAEFIQACKPDVDPLKAYYEALEGIKARAKGEDGIWSSPAIFWAMVAVSSYDMQNSTYSAIRNRWERELELQLEKSTHEPIPKPLLALTNEVQPINRQEAQKRVGELGLNTNQQWRRDHKHWAKNIIANPKRYPAYSLKCAQEALNMTGEIVE